MRDWSKYIQNTKGKDPNPSIREAISYTKARERALDIAGCGTMSDVDVMTEMGFKQIDAIDSEASIAVIAEEKRLAGIPLTFSTDLFYRFLFQKDTYDFINAQNSIPFAGSVDAFNKVMDGITFSIKSEGVFAGTFFGPEDDWAGQPDVVISTRESLEEFFTAERWNIHKFEGDKSVGLTASGKEKKWHVFTVIAGRLGV